MTTLTLRSILGIVFGYGGFIAAVFAVLASLPGPHSLNPEKFDVGTFLMIGIGLAGLTSFALLHEDKKK